MKVRQAKSAWVLLLLLTPWFSSALGDERSPDMVGLWRGSYVCGQGVTGLTLVVTEQHGPHFAGYFHFYPTPQNEVAKEGCFAVHGMVDPGRSVTIEADGWIMRPAGYSTVGLDGRLIDTGLAMTGKVTEPRTFLKMCRAFELNRHATTAAIPPACQSLQS